MDFLVRQRFERNVRELGEWLKQSMRANPDGELRMLPEVGGTVVAPPRDAESEEASANGPSEDAVRSALDLEHWNVSKAAERLGRSRREFYRDMEKYGITRPSKNS